MSDTKYYEDTYNKELHCKYWNEEHKECSQSHSMSINQEDYERYRQAEYKIGYANGYSRAENDYHKQISKDLQSSYDLGCITTIEKVQEWCTEQSKILKKQSEDFNDEECFGGYRAFEDMIRYLDTIK